MPSRSIRRRAWSAAATILAREARSSSRAWVLAIAVASNSMKSLLRRVDGAVELRAQRAELGR